MFQKVLPFRSKKLMAAAKDCPTCMCCGDYNDGTVVGCHYSGFRQHELGKGGSTKGTDTAVAFMCYECHLKFDGYDLPNDEIRSEEFLFAIVKTLDYLLKEGVFK